MADNCTGCLDTIPKDSDDVVVDFNGDLWCGQCHTICDACGEPVIDTYTVFPFEQQWCGSCRRDRARTCYVCDEVTDEGYIYHTYLDYHGWVYLCQSEFDNGDVGYCAEEYCETAVRDRDMSATGRCSECCDNVGSDDIHYYSYAPSYEFVKAPLETDPAYFGVELEVEVNDMHDAVQSVTSLVQLTPNRQPVLYLKEDCSINHGFEIVSHPSSYEAWRTGLVVTWSGWQQSVGVQRNESSVGMHIHVGRDAFDSPSHLWKFGLFHYRNSVILQQFAGRSYSSYCEWTEDTDRWNLKRRLKDYGGDRYSPLNFQNDATIELRYFQSDERKSRMLGRIGFVDALIRYTRQLDVAKYKANGLTMVRFINWLIDQPDADRYADTIEQLAAATTPENIERQRERNGATIEFYKQEAQRERERKLESQRQAEVYGKIFTRRFGLNGDHTENEIAAMVTINRDLQSYMCDCEFCMARLMVSYVADIERWGGSMSAMQIARNVRPWAARRRARLRARERRTNNERTA